jgi:hypothetical protein
MSVVGVMRKLVEAPERASVVAGMTSCVRHLEAIAQLLTRKIDMEHKYLARLEGARRRHTQTAR